MARRRRRHLSALTDHLLSGRQSTRTRITEDTTRAFFVLDGLDPLGADGTSAAADALVEALRAVSPGAAVTRRMLTA